MIKEALATGVMVLSALVAPATMPSQPAQAYATFVQADQPPGDQGCDGVPCGQVDPYLHRGKRRSKVYDELTGRWHYAHYARHHKHHRRHHGPGFFRRYFHHYPRVGERQW